MGGRVDGPHRRRLHAVGVDGRAHAVQPGSRRDREGSSRPRDRRAGRTDGDRDRRDGHSVQAAQSQPRSRGLVAARAGRQAPLQRMGTRGAAATPDDRLDHRAGRTDSARQQRRCRSGARVGRHVSLPRARDHDGHIPERPRARRPRSAAVGAGGRASVERSGRVDQVARLHVGTTEDRHAAASRSQIDRLLALRARARRRPARRVLVHDRSGSIARRSTVISCTRPIACTSSFAATSTRRPSSTGRSAASALATVRRSRTR